MRFATLLFQCNRCYHRLPNVFLIEAGLLEAALFSWRFGDLGLLVWSRWQAWWHTRSPVHSWRMFSACRGLSSENSTKSIRPTFSSLMLTSASTRPSTSGTICKRLPYHTSSLTEYLNTESDYSERNGIAAPEGCCLGSPVALGGTVAVHQQRQPNSALLPLCVWQILQRGGSASEAGAGGRCIRALSPFRSRLVLVGKLWRHDIRPGCYSCKKACSDLDRVLELGWKQRRCAHHVAVAQWDAGQVSHARSSAARVH